MVWWSDPGKEVLNILFNRVLAPYVENLDMNQVNYGIGQGQITLSKLRLKRGALDKFRLPVDVIDGHLGKLSLSLHWMNLGNQPVEVLVEDVYLLVVPSSESTYDPEEEERRAQAAKFERLESAELLHVRSQTDVSQDDTTQSQGLIASLVTKIVNNLQVTVRNIHIRYEDKLSVPGHPFTAGVTLAGFTAVSVNDQWQPAFIDSKAGSVHKLARLESLAVYFDTDCQSLAGLSYREFVEKFTALISKGSNLAQHQFILKPVSGEGKITMNHKLDKETPRFDVQLSFDEIGVLLDEHQYRDAISLIDMYHFYIRQHQYQKYRPSAEELQNNRPKALLQFATTAILDEVRERKRKWTWAYFAERRDDRQRYVDLFKRKQLGALSPAEIGMFEALERKLSYEDLRFYRSIARSQLRKDMATRRKVEEERKKQQPQKQTSWSSWIWGSSSSPDSSNSSSSPDEAAFTGEMTDEQRRQLYEALDYDEKAALAESLDTPRDALKARVKAQLNRGSFALKTDPHGKNTEIISVVSDIFQATFLQRQDNFETSLSLGGFAVRDGTTANSAYPLIVHVQEKRSQSEIVKALPVDDKNVLPGLPDPFFFLKFERNPLDGRADSALTVRMRYMEIVYHRGYVEAVYKFLKPPASQLESVEALLNVASQTLESLQKETRIGLEYALQTHKTVDVQMDLNAPIIIVPEDVTSTKGKHLVIDAGHISIVSELASKEAIQEIHAKRRKQYTAKDYEHLESMMYDRLTVKLQAAQFLVGDDLNSCLKALRASEHDNLHLLERTNFDLQVQNSIVPTAYNLARFKVSGHLPTLQVNMSDTKYKALMRLIDVAIPHFDDEAEPRAYSAHRPSTTQRHASGAFKIPAGFFGASTDEYAIETDDEDAQSVHSVVVRAPQKAETPQEQGEGDDEFFEADPGAATDPALHQHVVEIDLKVDALRASLYKSMQDGTEKSLGDLALQGFALDFAMEKYVMKVGVNLRSLSIHVNQVGKEPLEFMSSPNELMSSADGPSTEDLLTVKYTRVQQASPEYQPVYEGIDQNVDVKISTFLFRAAPEPVVTLYDFIMTTFVPQNNAGSAEATPAPGTPEDGNATPEIVVDSGGSPEKIRVLLTLASIQVILINDDVRIATLSLSTAYVAILLRSNTMRINGRLGSLALNDDSAIQTASPDFKKILSIEGDNFADFTYQTYDPADHENYTGVKSSISLQTGSLKVHYLEHTLRDAYLFTMKLARLKGLYDAATEAAVQRASEIERMKFDVKISTPIVVFPNDAQHSLDVLTLRLGALDAHNFYEKDVDRIVAGLHGIQLASRLYHGEEPAELKIVDDIDINADVTQKGNIDRSKDLDYPATQVAVKISDVKLHLTQSQYCLLINLLQSIPKVFADVPEAEVTTPRLPSPIPTPESDISQSSLSEATSAVDLRPELSSQSVASRPWTSLDLVVTMDAVKLHLYDAFATTMENVKEHGIARFVLKDNSLRLKMLSDGALEAQVILKSMTMNNTRPGHSRFREIMPAAQHERNQVMLLFTMSGGKNSQGLAVLTVDSPEIIFAVDPVIALLEFFTSAFTSQPQENGEDAEDVASPETQSSNSSSSVDFRIDLHDVSVSILEDDTHADTQAIKLSVKQLLVSQQGVFAVSVEHVGMSLGRMGKPAESVRFLDDLDFTLTLDSRSSASHQSTSIEVTALPIVFRASYRDIMLIMTIVNKAIELYGKSSQSPEQSKAGSEKALTRPAMQSRKVSRPTASRIQPIGSARVMMNKEQFKGSFEGFRLVLIGDLHEQPLLHLKVKPFILGAKDWSGELQATSTLSVHTSYWNLANSHWEPLIDPWTLTASVARELPSGGMKMSINSNQRLDVNVTMTFVELALATMSMLGTEGERVLEKARGSYAPYKIWNRTGYPLFIWSDTEGSGINKETKSKQIANGKTIDWRFDDWKTMREHVSSSGRNSIGVQIVGKQWEHLRSVPVDREGEYTFSLRPRTEKYAHRLVCEVKVQGNVKMVVLRSTYKVENNTLYPLELTLVDETGQPVYAVEKIVPGQDYALPLDAVNQCRVRVQPDQGFGYKWSPAVRWEDLIAKRGFTLRCPHTDQTEAAFRFQAWADADTNDIASRKLPRITLKLRAPIELENLLPYNLEYRIYDKDTDQNWRSYLRKGGVMPVHSVELGHLILLNIHVQDTVFKPSDFAIINTDGNSDFDVENKLVLRDANGRKLDLKLNYIHYPNSGGSFKVQVYSPYIVLNKTGLPFYVRPSRSTRVGTSTDVAGETRLDVLSKPVPFMLSHPNDNGKDFAFKIGDSMWSQGVSFDAPTAETRLVMAHQTQRSDEIHVGLSWTEGLGKYKLTKVITLAPRFIIKNNFHQPLAFREHGVAPRGRATMDPEERRPLHFLRIGDEKLLTVALPGLNAQWSPAINLEDIGRVHFRLPTSESDQQVRLMRADVKIDGPTIFVYLDEATEGWPFKIENDSDYSFSFSQTDRSRENAGPSAKPMPMYTVPQKSNIDYAWDAPAARDKRILLSIQGSRREVDPMEIGDLVPFRFAGDTGTRVVSLDVRADGPQQVLRISNYNAELSLYKPRRRSTVSLTRQDSMSSSQEAFEAVQETVSPTLTVSLDLHGVGVSLVNRRMVEVVYLSLNTLKFEYANNPVAQSVTLSCGSLQIDNQLHDALFPVVLQPTPISQESKTVAALPTVQASVIWLNDEEHGVLFVKYCSVLLQALTVEADEDFLFSVYDLTKIKGASWDVAREDILLEHPEDIPEPESTARGQDLYFEVLELQPIKLAISFMRTERVSGEEKLSLRNPFAVVLNAITMAVGNVNDAPLEMNALAIKDMRLTLPDLQSRIMYHYRQEVLRQLYRILGSADFIGNPVGLFTNVSSGVADIFYEPFNGVVVHGNKDIGIGIAKGAASFVKKTVFGFSDSFTKFTSSVGKGLSATTFDSEYQLKRRMNQRRNRPRHAIYGVAAGAEAFASSVVSGVEGVVMKPIEGAESEGAKGFFKGVGKGLIGAVTKPVIGVFDLASNVGEGIRNTTTVFDNPARDRVRMPRLIPADGVLVPYSDREALGQYWMKDLDNGAYREETYVAHLNLPGGDNVVLLTTTKVISFWSNKLRLDWELPFTQVQGVTIEDTGIKFAHKAGKQHDKFIYIPDKSSQTWFFSQVASVVKAFNARRRMDS
ncbi:vacuolar protein sorting-associated protein 13 [Lentinus tigrinus ALCF2SS1-6]|uniref:Vacuolar protein sorting-associated protein 13 n=1 Tax=Lentinus tigrinus ALCF2SS1-6 TaxID=1328759 RepID=A0A5C2SGJ2_9APHY|nr:vacuolar protein sorting-associated protein 13 [Lentinus tigrinus ALCF2SS1-6]